LEKVLIEEIVKRALLEDIGSGDITSDSIFYGNEETAGVFLLKQDGVIAGLNVAAAVFEILSPCIKFTPKIKDGEELQKGAIIAEIQGPTAQILKGERVTLNFLQHLSGIATMTRQLVKKIQNTGAKITDTRKTTPGLRVLEKYAVRVGGGVNHRFGLYDSVLIKDNHIKAAGGIKPAVQKVRMRLSHTMKIEVETESPEQVSQALEAGADIIMLDNMDAPTMKQAVDMIGGQAITEASGGITEQNIAYIARTGVDYISVGALTHSVKALDISLDFM